MGVAWQIRPTWIFIRSFIRSALIFHAKPQKAMHRYASHSRLQPSCDERLSCNLQARANGRKRPVFIFESSALNRTQPPFLLVRPRLLSPPLRHRQGKANEPENESALDSREPHRASRGIETSDPSIFYAATHFLKPALSANKLSETKAPISLNLSQCRGEESSSFTASSSCLRPRPLSAS